MISKLCPDCGLPEAVRYGDRGCLARCPEEAFRNPTQCLLNTVNQLRSDRAELRQKVSELETRVTELSCGK